MRKIFLCILFTIQFFAISYSQNANDKGYISLLLGPSIPVGNYASSNFSNSKAGFAGLGENLNISYCRLLGKNFGIAAELLGQINPLNVKAMEKSFATQKFAEPYFYSTTGPPQTPPLPVYVTYQHWNFDKKSWQSGSMLLGAYMQLPLNHSGNISFTTKAMIGAIYLSSPQLNGEGYTDTSLIKLSQSTASAFGFAYSLSAGLKYDFNKRLSFLVSVEYLGTAKITFKNVTETIITENGAVIPGMPLNSANYSSIARSTAIGNESQKLSALNINIGIGLKL
jgi:hypothetical protein